MKNKIRTITSIFIIFIIFSCKDENVNEKKIENDNIAVNTINFEFEFPDTVYKNKLYDGKIKYKSVLDTIITTFGNEDKNRYTRFIMLKTKNIDYDFRHLKKVAIDSFGAIDNRTIPFYDINFKEVGTYYIDGIINDIVSIDTLTKPPKGDYLVRFIENEVRATHKVVVIEKP